MVEYRDNLFGFGEVEGNGKLYEDRYELYVNGDYIGNKTLLNLSDDLKDVDSFLNGKGFSNFKAELEGDHYKIEAASEEAEGISDALSVYVNNR